VISDGWAPGALRSKARIAEIRAELLDDPIGVVVVDDLIDETAASEMTELFDGARFEDECRLVGGSDPVSLARWLAASDDERLWRVGRLRSTTRGHGLGSGALALLSLGRSMASLGAWLAEILGEPLGEGRGPVPVMLEGHHSLRPHVLDPSVDRVRVEVFVSPWEPGWGGELVAVGPAERVMRITPARCRGLVIDAKREPTLFVSPRSRSAAPRTSLVVTFAPLSGGGRT
jgi:hypothetical protein